MERKLIYKSKYNKYKRKYIDLKSIIRNRNIIPFVFIYGPHGSGKTTTASILESMSVDKFKHIDHDILDLGRDKVSLLTGEKEPYSTFKVVESIIIDKKIPIICYYQNNIQEYFNKIFKNLVSLSPIILLPYIYATKDQQIIILDHTNNSQFIKDCNDQLKDLSKPIMNDGYVKSLYDIYHDDKRLRNSIKQRIESGKYYLRKQYEEDTFRFVKTGLKMKLNILFEIIINLITNSKLTKIIFFPVISPILSADGSKIQNISMPQIKQIFDEIKNLQITNKIKPIFTQKRLLIDYTIPNSIIKYYNIKIKFEKNIQLINYINDPDMIYTRKKVRGTLFTLIPKDIIDLMKEIQGSKYMVGFTPVLNNYSNFINSENVKNLLKYINESIALSSNTLEKINNFKRLLKFFECLEDPESNINYKKYKFMQIILFPEIGKLNPGRFDDYFLKGIHVTVNSGPYRSYDIINLSRLIYNSIDKKITIEKDSNIYMIDEGINIACNTHNLYYV